MEKEIIAFFKKSGGYATMKQLKEEKITAFAVKELVLKEILEKIKPGLYRLSNLDEPDNINLDLIDVAKACPKGVICLISALSYYDLTTFNPSKVEMAIPHSASKINVIYPPVKNFFFRERFYSPGINKIKTAYGVVKIYNIEKTICDLFRYRKKVGEDLALEGLKNYLKGEFKNLNKLRKYTKICQVKTIITPYIKSIVG